MLRDEENGVEKESKFGFVSILLMGAVRVESNPRLPAAVLARVTQNQVFNGYDVQKEHETRRGYAISFGHVSRFAQENACRNMNDVQDRAHLLATSEVC